MYAAFLKSLRWYIMVVFVIIGTAALIIADERDTVRPVIIAVFSYGVVYIMSVFWKEFRDKILFYSAAVFLALTFLSKFTPIALYILFGYAPETINQYYAWAGTVALGMPMMTIVFYRLD